MQSGGTGHSWVHPPLFLTCLWAERRDFPRKGLVDGQPGLNDDGL